MAINYNKILKEKEKDINKENNERLERCVPLAQKIIEMIAEAKLPIGTLADKDGKMKEEVNKKYSEFSAEVLALMLQSNLKFSERNFVWQLVLQPIDQAKEKVINSLNRSFERANEEKWGKDEMDITMGDIHDVLINIGK